MQILFYKNPTLNALTAAILTVGVLAVSFFAFEPSIAYGIADSFTVTQEVTSEISFKTAPNDVTMAPPLQGITGGNSFGTSTVAITTNNTTGYNMTIHFATTTAMQGIGVTSDIDNYTPSVGGTPDYNFSVGANDAEFAYTVNGVTTPGDIDARFKDNGSACNTGAGTSVGKCWYGTANAVTPVTIINRTTATAGTGATSTIVFQVGITSNPSPAIAEAFYTATATLTAVTN
ncbi:MAG: hypothetical protein RLZZ76_512 [Candidatus Parcubacteria bacterium]|jgi:hypothetical protein